MLELLCLITNLASDKKIKEVHKKYNLPFNMTSTASGTASSSVLEYFGLEEIKKYIYFSFINSTDRSDILKDINNKLNLKKPGSGICFTIPISSSTKYIKEKLGNKEELMDKIELNHHLIVTVVNEGFTEEVMNTAKAHGAGGGTLIRGRSLSDPSSAKKFLGFSIEPEKDVVLIVSNDKTKNDIMNAIVKKAGLKTKGSGIIFSLPITEAIGLNETIN